MWAALCASALAAAQQPARGLVEQKESLVRRLLGDGPTVRRVAASGSDEARRQMEIASAMHARSLEHLQRGELKEAETRLDEAMRALGRARQLAPDGTQRAAERRERYERLRQSVAGLREAYARHLRRTSGAPAAAPVRDEVLDAVAQRTENARRLYEGERPVEAAQALEGAEQALLEGLNRVLGAATLDYAPRFDSAAEEYGYELERNRSYATLVPAALEELRPSGAARQLVQRYVETNAALVTLAGRQASERDWRAALDNLRSGTSYLQRALGAAGLVVPQVMKD
jgi:hypothetical protein